MGQKELVPAWEFKLLQIQAEVLRRSLELILKRRKGAAKWGK